MSGGGEVEQRARPGDGEVEVRGPPVIKSGPLQHIHCSHLTSSPCFFVLFHSCCSHAQVKTPVR